MKFLQEKDDAATVIDSGSTNASGFRIVVQRSGKAACTTTPRRNARAAGDNSKPKQQQLSQALVDRLFSDLSAAKPLSALPAQHCMKSASFGTSRTIEFGGQRTPDLNCGDGGNSKLRALIQDVNEIVNIFAPNRAEP
jgi:hypothetical protein